MRPIVYIPRVTAVGGRWRPEVLVFNDTAHALLGTSAVETRAEAQQMAERLAATARDLGGSILARQSLRRRMESRS